MKTHLCIFETAGLAIIEEGKWDYPSAESDKATDPPIVGGAIID